MLRMYRVSIITWLLRINSIDVFTVDLNSPIVTNSYTGAYNLTGWPGAVVRAGSSPEGLPLGVQIVAQPWREDVALAVARHLETTLGGWQCPVL
jgi:Asp-tRNA(Asn)/Glu-tRNA(Gln) amidotransferase A subunit family amidase